MFRKLNTINTLRVVEEFPKKSRGVTFGEIRSERRDVYIRNRDPLESEETEVQSPLVGCFMEHRRDS